MNINEAKRKVEQCEQKNRYETVEKEINIEFFKIARTDIIKALEELEKEDVFWALEKLCSAINLFIYGLSIKKLSLLPKSLVCGENLILANEFINSIEYELLQDIRILRNESMYHAIRRTRLDKKIIARYIEEFSDLMDEVLEQ